MVSHHITTGRTPSSVGLAHKHRCTHPSSGRRIGRALHGSLCAALLVSSFIAAAAPAGPHPPTIDIPCDYGILHAQPRVEEPAQLIGVGTNIYGHRQQMAPRAAAALLRMRDAAARDGINLQVVSAFRSIRYQQGIVRRKLASGQDLARILRVNAAPGYSQHHSGRAVDLATPGYDVLEIGFERSPAFAWLRRHGAQFSFRLSYPRGNVHNIDYEPWHWYWNPDEAPPTLASASSTCPANIAQISDAKGK